MHTRVCACVHLAFVAPIEQRHRGDGAQQNRGLHTHIHRQTWAAGEDGCLSRDEALSLGTTHHVPLVRTGRSKMHEKGVPL